MLALLRCIPTNISAADVSQNMSGDVVYSGRSIGQVSRTVLRKKLTIIPQTVRFPRPNLYCSCFLI